MARQGRGAKVGKKPKVWAATGRPAASIKPARILKRRTDRLRPAEYAPASGRILASHGYQSLNCGAALVGRNAFDELHAGALNAARRDAREGAQQAQRIGRVEEAEDGAGVLRSAVRRAEEERHRYIERLGDPHQPAGADPVHALLVFLHLLKRDAEQVAELGLRHALGHAPRPDALADFDIVRRGTLGLGFHTHARATPP